MPPRPRAARPARRPLGHRAARRARASSSTASRVMPGSAPQESGGVTSSAAGPDEQIARRCLGAVALRCRETAPRRRRRAAPRATPATASTYASVFSPAVIARSLRRPDATCARQAGACTLTPETRASDSRLTITVGRGSDGGATPAGPTPASPSGGRWRRRRRTPAPRRTTQSRSSRRHRNPQHRQRRARAARDAGRAGTPCRRWRASFQTRRRRA